MGPGSTSGSVHGNGENDNGAAMLGGAIEDAASAGTAPAAGSPTGGAGGANLIGSLASRAAWVEAQTPNGKPGGAAQCHASPLATGGRDNTRRAPESGDAAGAAPEPRSFARARALRFDRNADGRRDQRSPTGARAGGGAAAGSGPRTSPTRPTRPIRSNSAMRLAAGRFASQLVDRVKIGQPLGSTGFSDAERAAAYREGGEGDALTRSPPQSFTADGHFEFTPNDGAHPRMPIAPARAGDVVTAMDATFGEMEHVARALCEEGGAKAGHDSSATLSDL